MTLKIATSLMIILLIVIVSFSGCIKNEEYNTWGEKNISLDAIKVTDNTTGNRSQANSSKYYVDGYIINENVADAVDVKIKVITYDSNSTIFAVNDTPNLKPSNIPGKQMAHLYASFNDPDKKIVKFKVEIIDAKSQYTL